VTNGRIAMQIAQPLFSATAERAHLSQKNQKIQAFCRSKPLQREMISCHHKKLDHMSVGAKMLRDQLESLPTSVLLRRNLYCSPGLWIASLKTCNNAPILQARTSISGRSRMLVTSFGKKCYCIATGKSSTGYR
jgi:hypothetical protein